MRLSVRNPGQTLIRSDDFNLTASNQDASIIYSRVFSYTYTLWHTLGLLLYGIHEAYLSIDPRRPCIIYHRGSIIVLLNVLYSSLSKYPFTYQGVITLGLLLGVSPLAYITANRCKRPLAFLYVLG